MNVKIGVIGCANIAIRSLIPAIKEMAEDFSLVGIASRSYDKAIKYAAQFNTKPYFDYLSLLDAIQAVYIPLPNALHAFWIEKAISKGVHILSEKPMVCQYDDAIRLNELAQANQIVLMENFQFRFHNQLEFIKNILSSAVIGELRCLRSSFGFSGLSNTGDIRLQKDLGGGALLDTGVYPLKISQIFLGEDIDVKAANLNYLDDHIVDIWGGAYLKQRNGHVFSQIAFGFDNHYQCNFELWGSKGKLCTNRIFTAPKDYKPKLVLENQNGKEIIELDADNHFKNMLQHFHKLIKHKNKLNDEYLQNINQARLMEEIRLVANE